MKISVISAAYNMEKVFSFRSSFESILNQTFSDFEFIICDDGSSDATFSVLEEYAERDKRIVLLRNKKNLGLAASLNACIEASSGEYVARSDLDDISLDERLRLQSDFLDENRDISLLGTAAYLFDGGGIYAKRIFPGRVRREDFLFSSPYMHGSVMFRREALLHVGGYRVAKETRRTEDYDLFMRMALFCDGANLTAPLYCYLENSDTKARRKYKYRIDEAVIRAKGFRALGLMPRGIPYVLKPLAVGLIPGALLDKLKSVYYKEKIKDE